MGVGRTALQRQAGDAAGRRYAIDVAVPYAGADSGEVLDSEWRRQGSGSAPVPRVTLPRRSEGVCTFRVRERALVDLVVQEIHTDQHSGWCEYDDTIKICFSLGGDARFTLGQDSFATQAGHIFAADSGTVWNWEVSSPLQMLILMLPAHEAGFPKRRRTISATQDSPGARLLLAHLRSLIGLRDETTHPRASRAARDATLALFHGLVESRVIDDEEFSLALVGAAMEWVDARLLEHADLSPGSVAAALNVSVRTLHRAFANETVSVMGYVREQRLKRARWDLAATSLSVHEIAARWHFADASHFIRAYKKQFGEVPGDLRRERRSPDLPDAVPGPSAAG